MYQQEHKDLDKCKAKIFHAGRWCRVRDHLQDIRDGKVGGVVVEKGTHADAVDAIEKVAHGSAGGERALTSEQLSKLWLLVSSGELMSPRSFLHIRWTNADMIHSCRTSVDP